MTYRLRLPMVVLAFENNHQAATTIPAGQIIDVIGPAMDDRFFVIASKGEQFHVFASDLVDRRAQNRNETERISTWHRQR